MVTQWMILLSVASVALGGEQKRDQPPAAVCCDYQKAVAILYTPITVDCINPLKESAESKEYDSEEKEICVTDCALIQHGLINFKDVSVKEPELRKLLVNSAPSEAKDVVKAALDKCFAKPKDEEYLCASRSDDLLYCILNEIADNCPDELWSTNKECQPKEKNVLHGGVEDAADKSE